MSTTDGIVITCMDPRIDPLAILTMDLPRAVIIRTPGGRVTSEAMDGIAVARGLFGIEWIVVMHHGDCGLSRSRTHVESLASEVIGSPISLAELSFIEDPGQALAEDVEVVAQRHGAGDGPAIAGCTWDPNTDILALSEVRGPAHLMLSSITDQ